MANVSQSPAPDFSKQIDPGQFTVPGEADLENQLTKQNTADNSVQYDWSGVNGVLGQLASQQGAADQLATGHGLTAGTETAMGQQDFSHVAGNSKALGLSLMKLGGKAQTGQAQAVGEAQNSQQTAAAQQAEQLKQTTVQAQMGKLNAELNLQNTKFQQANVIKQTQDGLQLANAQLMSMYNSLVANARNATDLGNIQTSMNAFQQSMQYIGTALGVGSTAGAAAASYFGGPMSTAQTAAQNASDAGLAAWYNKGSSDMYNSATNSADSWAGRANATVNPATAQAQNADEDF